MEQQDRLHALDAVRALALLLGIVLHATMSFLPALAENFFIVDNSQSTTLSVTFAVIHIFRMTMFFVMAGFFARLVLYRRGTQGFIRDRAKRILAPLVVSWPLVIALLGAAMAWGSFKAGKPFVPPPPGPNPVLLPFPLTHLWFLYVLLLLYVGLLSARWLANTLLDRSGKLRSIIDTVMRAITSIPIAPFILALPVASALYASSPWVTWGGIPTPDNSLIPNLAAMVGYGIAITFGWFLHRQSALLNTFRRYWIGYSVAAIALTVACLYIGGTPSEKGLIKLAGLPRAFYAGLYGLTAWCATFAIIGAAGRFLSAESKPRRYLADASYWMYIFHLPIVFALQALVMLWPIHWALKFTLIMGVTTSVLLVTYHYWVRSTYIGEVLNGRRYPRRVRDTAAKIATTVRPALTSNAADGNNSLASLTQAKKNYGAVTALDGIDLDIRRGELLAMLGPNGAGKSTAIALLLGLQQATSGTVQLFGRSPHELDARRRVGVMMQEVTLAPELKVREHIDLTASYYPQPMTVAEALTLTRLTELAERPYRQLSGGQKRQVQFAMAICGRPKLLFLDEPTVGLDVQARETMWQAIRHLIADGCSIVLTTHYLEEAEALADRVIVVNRGRTIASGTVAELRSVVSRRQISCASNLPVEHVSSWNEVAAVRLDQGRLSITTANAESVVRRLLAEDTSLTELEVRRAGLSDVFTELTQETA